MSSTRRLTKRSHGMAFPTLPDNCWQHVFSFFTENKEFFGCSLVCRKWADIVRNSKTLESVGFVWDKSPATSSTRRAELFLDWLGTRLGKKTAELELALVPENPSVVTQTFKNTMWCLVGQMAASLRHLAIKANAGMVTDVGPWIHSFTNLEYLLLAPRGNSLSVRSSLAGLTKLKDLVLSVKQHDLLDNVEDPATFLASQNPKLHVPEAHPKWLPTSLTALRLECFTLTTLPPCLSMLTNLEGLELNTRTTLTNTQLILQHTGLSSLELCGCVAPSFLGHLSTFERLRSLTLSHLALGDAFGTAMLAQGVGHLKQLKSLSLTYCHLAGFPQVVRTLPHLIFLDISFNPEVVTFPDGEHVRSLQLVATDWAAVSPDPSRLLAAKSLEELCLTDRPPSSEAVASVLRTLGSMPLLTAVYFDVGPETQMTHEVVMALAGLARDCPFLQFKTLEDCPW